MHRESLDAGVRGLHLLVDAQDAGQVELLLDHVVHVPLVLHNLQGNAQLLTFVCLRKKAGRKADSPGPRVP